MEKDSVATQFIELKQALDHMVLEWVKATGLEAKTLPAFVTTHLDPKEWDLEDDEPEEEENDECEQDS